MVKKSSKLKGIKVLHFIWSKSFLFWMIFSFGSRVIIKIEPCKLVLGDIRSRLNFICFWTRHQAWPESPDYKSDVAHWDKGNESWREKRREEKRMGREEKGEAKRMYFNLARSPAMPLRRSFDKLSLLRVRPADWVFRSGWL